MSAQSVRGDEKDDERMVSHIASELVRHYGISPPTAEQREKLKTLDPRDLFDEHAIRRLMSSAPAGEECNRVRAGPL